MEILIVSDIHGSKSSILKMEEALSLHKIKNILCLGDILYHGPRNDLPDDYLPKEIIPILNKYSKNIIAIQGNCDSEVDQMVLEFPILNKYNILFLNEKKLFVSHGHTYNFNNLPKLNKNDIFMQGHTHIPFINKENGIYLLNPGSISLPKENNPRTYGIISEERFTIYDFNHNVFKEIKF